MSWVCVRGWFWARNGFGLIGTGRTKMTLRLGGVGYFLFYAYLLIAFLASLAQAPLQALEQVCAGPQSAGSLKPNLSLSEISGYYWRLDPPFAALVTAGATGSDYPGGHTM